MVEILVELLMINGGYAKIGMSGAELYALHRVRCMLQEVNKLAACKDYSWGANPTGLRYAFRIEVSKLSESNLFALELGDDADDIKLALGKKDGMCLVDQLARLFQGKDYWKCQRLGGVETIKISLRLHGHDAAEWVCKGTLAGSLAYEKKAAKAVLERFSVFIELLLARRFLFTSIII